MTSLYSGLLFKLGRSPSFLHAVAGAGHRQKNLAQEDDQPTDESDHGQNEHPGDQTRQICPNKSIDERRRNDQADEQSAKHFAHQRDVDQAQAVAESTELLCKREIHRIRRRRLLFENADPVDNAREPGGQHTNDRPDRGEQEYRCNSELDDMCDVNINERDQSALLRMNEPISFQFQ